MASPIQSKRQKVSWLGILSISVAVLLMSILLFYYNQDELLLYSEPNATTMTTIDTTNEDIITIDTQSSSALPLRYLPFTEYLKTKETILNYNRLLLLKAIKKLVSLDYFRYVKVNLNRPCTLWCDAAQCNRPDCEVKVMSDPNKCPVSTYDEELSTVNTELASDQLDLLIKLFECNDNDDHNLQYVDLQLNPERYTGYKGKTANRVWKAIYEENCFVRKSHSPFNSDLCYEERLFYEAISGLHTSINVHLSAQYPCNPLMFNGCREPFEPNLDEFLRRFDRHNDYIENLFTLFLLELKALSISEPYLMKRVKWPDTVTKNAIQDLYDALNKVNIPMFEDLSLKPSHVSHDLALHFHNITTTIIDCVACDKCKLWGKVQLRGLGAAFKILSLKDVRKLNLNHQEIVSFINAIARLSYSVLSLETFRDMILSRDYNSMSSAKPTKLNSLT